VIHGMEEMQGERTKMQLIRGQVFLLILQTPPPSTARQLANDVAFVILARVFPLLWFVMGDSDARGLRTAFGGDRGRLFICAVMRGLLWGIVVLSGGMTCSWTLTEAVAGNAGSFGFIGAFLDIACCCSSGMLLVGGVGRIFFASSAPTPFLIPEEPIRLDGTTSAALTLNLTLSIRGRAECCGSNLKSSGMTIGE